MLSKIKMDTLLAKLNINRKFELYNFYLKFKFWFEKKEKNLLF